MFEHTGTFLSNACPFVSQSQIKVRDFSKLAVTLAPADYESWHVARTETMVRCAALSACLALG